MRHLIEATLRSRKIKRYADGGGDLSDADQAAMSPETYVNPVAKAVVGSIGDTIAAPGKLAAPNPYSPGSEEASWYEDQRAKLGGDWAGSTALSMVGGSGAVPAEANALRTGIGITARGGESFTNKFTQFTDNEAKGLTPEQNYQATGWYRGAEGQPRYWISDQGAKLNDNIVSKTPINQTPKAEIPPTTWNAGVPGKGDDPGRLGEWRDTKLGDVWDHPALFEAYPFLKDMKVQPETHPEYGGHFEPGTNTLFVKGGTPDKVEDVLHHEVIHAIQKHEGFTPGSTPDLHYPPGFGDLLGKFEDVKAAIRGQVRDAGYDPDVAKWIADKDRNSLSPDDRKMQDALQNRGLLDRLKTFKGAEAQVNQVKLDAWIKYAHVAGESEARDAPWIRRNPDKLQSGQIPYAVNPDLIPGRSLTTRAEGGAIKMATGGSPLSGSDLPPGFEIDPPAGESGGASGLPPGFEVDQPAPQTSVGADVAKSAGVGAGKGLIDFAGTAGDAANLLSKGSKVASDYLADTFGFDKGPEPTGPLLPTSGGIQKAIESKTGQFYQPKTTAGKFAGAVTETAANPLSYVGPGSVAGKLAGAAATGAGSEGAGELAQQYAPEMEPYARIAGGLLGGSAAGTVSASVENTMRARGIPTTQELKQAADTAYGNARALGVEYTPGQLVILRDQIQRDLLQKGFRADKSGGTFNRINELPDPPTPAFPGGNRNFSDIEGVRQSLREITGEVDTRGMRTSDAKAADRAIDRIDDFLEDPSKAVAGHQGIAAQQAQFAAEGRGNWGAMARSQQIEQVLAKGQNNAAATGSGANVDNALRQQVKQILNNPRRARNFTNDDRAIMQDILSGNPVRNSARLLGKMAITGIVSAGGIEYLSHLMGLGPVGHVLLPAAGYAAKKAGDIMTRNRYNSLLQNIRMDSPVGRANPVGPRATTAPYAIRSALTTPGSNPYAP